MNNITRTPVGNGFTLVELMVVLAITGVLAMVAAPAFKEIIEVQRAKSAATDIYAALVLTRSEALKRNGNVTLSPKFGGWTQGWQIPDPVSGTMLEDHGAVRNLTVTGPAGVTYQSSGRVQGASVSFSIVGTYPSATRYVCLDLGGRPSVKSTAC